MAYDERYTGMYGRTFDDSRRLAREAADRNAPGWQRAIELTNATEHGVTMQQFGAAPDAADMLPDAARTKLVRLRETREDALSAYRGLDDAFRHAQSTRTEAQLLVRKLTDPETAMTMGYPRPVRDSDGSDPSYVVEARAKLAAAEASLAQINTRRDVLAHKQQQATAFVERSERYLAAAWPGQPFEAFTGKLRKFATVDAARAELASLKGEMEAAWVAPWPSAVAKQKIRAEIGKLAARGKPGVDAVVNHGDEVRWPTQAVTIPTFKSDLVGWLGKGQTADALGLICWAIGDQIAKALDKEIDAVANDGIAMDDEQRNAALSRLSDQILDVERAEVSLAEAAGIDHRPDADVRALLGIVGPAIED